MSTKRTLGGILLAIGLLLLLVGIAMPSTTTTTSQTCYDDPMGYGQECIESTYETSTNKYPTLFFGFVMSVVGGALVRSDPGNASPGGHAREQPPDRQSNSDWTSKRGFAKQVEEAKQRDDES